MADTKSALKVFEGLSAKTKQLVKTLTRSAVRRKKMNIASIDTTAQTVTVYEAANPADTITIPYRAESGISQLSAGQSVQVEWIYDDLSTAVAAAPGKGWASLSDLKAALGITGGGGGGGVSILAAYPVGSIYMSVNSTNPGTLFGGTWQQLKDRFLLAAGDAYAAGATGGEAAHLLTASEAAQKAVATGGMSANITHDHNYKAVSASIASGTNFARPLAWTSTVEQVGYQSSPANIEHTHSIAGADAASAHNNMPPYLTVYMWQRIA